VRAPIHRRLSSVVLLVWMAPGMGALAVGVHLALDHHGAHGAEHEREVSDLVRAATHGHHHDAEAAPSHEHDARVGRVAPIPRRGPSLVAVLPSPAAATAAGSQWPRADRTLRRGPPVPLLTAHCSLLL
jgi:hypothetical protein